MEVVLPNALPVSHYPSQSPSTKLTFSKVLARDASEPKTLGGVKPF